MNRPFLSITWPSAPWAPMDGWEAEDAHPRREDFPTHRAYQEAFWMWRARRRDGRLNDEELAAQFSVIEDALRGRGSR